MKKIRQKESGKSKVYGKDEIDLTKARFYTVVVITREERSEESQKFTEKIRLIGQK